MPKLSRFLLLGLCPAVVVCTTACQKSAERQRGIDEATAIEAKAEAERLKAKERNELREHLAAIRQEQLELRGRVKHEIADIDRRLLELELDPLDASVDLSTANGRKGKDLHDRRRRLDHDLGAIERSDERDWDAVREDVERDLGARSQI